MALPYDIANSAPPPLGYWKSCHPRAILCRPRAAYCRQRAAVERSSRQPEGGNMQPAGDRMWPAGGKFTSIPRAGCRISNIIWKGHHLYAPQLKVSNLNKLYNNG